MNDTTIGTTTYRYRAVITCADDRCRRCMQSGKAVHVPGKGFGTYATDITHATEEEARDYGHGMNSNVYGASTHRVSVQRMPVGEWEDIPTSGTR